jgi:arylsulfatase A
MRREASLNFLVAAIVCMFSIVTEAENAYTRFVFFLVGDPGWCDMGCFGSPCQETPYIDAPAAAGMKFTASYAACPGYSPTRLWCV